MLRMLEEKESITLPMHNSPLERHKSLGFDGGDSP